jgi:hypothetical protein
LIKITLLKQEICDTHELLVKYEDLVAPDASDPLHELLEDLGPVPSVATLLGSMYLAVLLKIESLQIQGYIEALFQFGCKRFCVLFLKYAY